MSKEAFLIIEDQKSMGLLLQNELQKLTYLSVYLCQSLAETQAFLESDVDVVACLSDLTLPDAPRGEAVALLQSHHITTVVLTGSYNEKTRQEMFKQKVADYVIKDGPASIRYAVQTLNKLYKNRQRHVFILSHGSKDASKLQGLLRIHCYQVSVYENFHELQMELQQSTPELILLDSTELFEEHELYGFVNEVRQAFSANSLPIISCESSEHIGSAIKLMKYGVNDFFNTRFTAEEFYARVNQNIEQAESFREIERISQTDALTGLLNRGHFFKRGEELFIELTASQKYFFVAMVDIDFFKKVNDTHGHQKGDEALVYAAHQVQDVFAEHLVARFGGEEFCVLGEVEDATEIEALCETLRARIETMSADKTGVAFTVSLGLTYSGASLEEGVFKADTALYRSKELGRNQLSTEF
ncbi:diguanylate cyclase/phosphodiesterase (GGDEF & EAL domains) with PAS/PAC sensor(s) [hydrothermal vent metagenome]|uniref:Diguanylate cyclase/phosphodiesterase (GGDEF & EAL domains) with PAS/PAC sensor(S) n=1 Tax=hydrothermal vent metagenome TaxID=652676 RepID=A0A3B0WAG6_9ZZZZ